MLYFFNKAKQENIYILFVQSPLQIDIYKYIQKKMEANMTKD